MWSVIHDDVISALRKVDDNQLDSIVTDPPYGLSEDNPDKVILALTHWLTDDRAFVPDGKGFMGKKWDEFVPPPAAWDEAYRVLKPGGYLLAFAGTRTYDLMCLSIRLAGFEIRDSLNWIYGSGFPKSRDISKAIDSEVGATRERVLVPTQPGNKATRASDATDMQSGFRDVSEPVTEAAKQWSGWGTALKPAHEPIVLARKPLAPKHTVAANVLEYGTGAINVDGCRVGNDKRINPPAGNKPGGASYQMSVTGMPQDAEARETEGRWPPNILLTHSPGCVPTGTKRVKGSKPVPMGEWTHSGTTGATAQRRDAMSAGYADADGKETVEAWDCADDCPVTEMDRQSGISLSQGGSRGKAKNPSSYGMDAQPEVKPGFGDTGGASRFFPVLNWSEEEREHFTVFRYNAKAPKKERPVVEGLAGHPTVKPLALIRWLVRLVTPPGGTCCDMFAGTGTLAEACELEGFNSVIIENDPDSIRRIDKRMEKYDVA